MTTPPDFAPLLREDRPAGHPLLRIVYLAAGIVCILLGVVGWLVPVITGIPFYVAGLWLLGLSSPWVRRKINATEARLSPRHRCWIRRILKRTDGTNPSPPDSGGAPQSPE